MKKDKPIVLYCLHDDHWFLRESMRSFSGAGPIVAFVSKLAWDGTPGDWEKCAEIAEAEKAEVVIGEWPSESIHRQFAQQTLRERGCRQIMIPDGDEIAGEGLIDMLLDIADKRLADRTHVHMDTYFGGPDYVIRPRERLTPAIMIDLERAQHVSIRVYEGGRALVLPPTYPVLHHLSYCGPDERIKRKIETSSHREEMIDGWYSKVWQGWKENRHLRNLHPTHPAAYGFTERISVPEALKECWNELPPNGDPEVGESWPQISVVIPVYGEGERLRACLESLADSKDLISQIVAVDDCSPDDAAQIAASFEGVELVRNERNLGFAATCNRGLSEARGDVVVFLNSDTLVPRSSLVRLIGSLMNSGSIGAAGPFSNNAGYHQFTETTYSGPDGLNLFAQDFAARDAEDCDVPMLVGFCLAVKKKVLDEIGNFDERFGKSYFEDNDLSLRILEAKFRLRLSGRAFVHHDGAASQGASRGTVDAQLAKNMLVYEDKWKRELESGYISHLPGQKAIPIVFREDRNPKVLSRLMKKLAHKANVTLCMIARNESAVLAECLESVQGVFSQIVFVDTGSTDETKEIAARYGAEVYDFPWVDSFAAARNESLKYAKGDFIFWLDCDDVLPRRTAEAILRAAIEAPKKMHGFIVPVQFMEGGKPVGTRVDHLKLYRNLPGLTWEGRIHEQIIPSLRARGGNIARIDQVVLHLNYDASAEGQRRKRERDERLLQLDLEERPDHPFPMFNMGMTLHYNGRHGEAAEWLKRCIAASKSDESHVRKAYALLGISKRELGDLEGALATYSEGLMTVGEDPELRFFSGIVLTALKRFAEAKEQYLAIDPDISGHYSSVDMAILGPKRFHNLGVVCLELDDFPGAREWFEKAMAAGFAPSGFALFEAATKREHFLAARLAHEAMERVGGPSEEWAEAGAELAKCTGNSPEAFLQDAYKRHHLTIGPRLVLARHLLREGREAEAERHVEFLTEMGCAEGAFYAGVLATQKGDLEGALARMKESLRLNPNSEEARKRIEALEKPWRRHRMTPSKIPALRQPVPQGPHRRSAATPVRKKYSGVARLSAVAEGEGGQPRHPTPTPQNGSFLRRGI